MTTNTSINGFDNQQSSSNSLKFRCSNCTRNVPREFDSLRGLRIHNTKCHPDSPPLIVPSLSGVSPSNVIVTENDFLKLFTLKFKVGILRRVPKGARPQAAKTYVQLIRNCIAFNDLSSWYQLFSFSYKAFHIPAQNKKDKARSLVALLGFGVRCGCEAAVHATRLYVSKHSKTNKVTLKIDYKNAYNTVQRDIMLSSIKAKTPLLYNYCWQCYAHSTVLLYDSNVILSSSGIQQGDPCGSFLFPLSIHHIVDDMESELNVWYQDDGTLSDFPDVVLADFAHLIDLSKDIGLIINPSKCELHFASGDVDSDVVICNTAQSKKVPDLTTRRTLSISCTTGKNI
ncbi:hypothetical protein Bhyg_11942, partial [Pseudolycoriella hygida]